MHRQIVLDTETTGLRLEEGHRIIEIGCLELIDRKLTGNHFHCYVNPQREVESGALAVHGINNEFLQSKPLFSDIAKAFMDFVLDTELIIHNAPFDLAFLNHELELTQQGWKSLVEYCRIIDTLQIARSIHVGQRNSLDALCKRYRVDLSKREQHGALLDAHLLAQIYLAMTGGQGSFFDSLSESQTLVRNRDTETKKETLPKYNLSVIKANEEELLEHEMYLKNMKVLGKCLWLDQ